MDGGSNAQSSMLQFLKQVNEKAKAKGIIPDSLSGDIGTIPGDDYLLLLGVSAQCMARFM